MATTTIRLPEDLKERIAQAASASGISAHAFILEAISEYVSDQERRADFYQVAEERYAKIADSGKTIGWPDMKQYLKARQAGNNPPRLRARKLKS